MSYRFVVSLVRMLLRVFFARVESTGEENVPTDGGGIVVSWHPNALVDGALILAHFPRRIVFGARHGLFRWPLLGAMMRAVGTVPIYRRQDFPASDENSRRQANKESLDGLARAVAAGSFAALFPEGISHDEPAPMELRTGAARLYFRAMDLTSEGSPPPVILPVGLHYDEKRLFGSRALVAFHPPLDLPGSLGIVPGESLTEEELRARYRELTAAIEAALHTVVHATESWEHHEALHRARTLFRAEHAHRAGADPGPTDMKERVLGFKRLWEGYNARKQTHPELVTRLFERTRDYDSELNALGLRDHELDQPPRFLSPWLAAIVLLQALLVYLVLPPVLVLGYIVNAPAALVVWLTSRWAAREHKDEASIKLLAGLVALPLTWLLVAALVAWGRTALDAVYPELWGSPLATAAAAFVLSAVGAYVALHYQRFARRTLRALRVRLTRIRRRRAIDRLREERARLYDAFKELSRGLELPGEIAPDGRVLE